MLIGSQLISWFKDTLESFRFDPKDITVTLLSPTHEPLEQWQFYKAWPTKWNIEGFDAEKSAIVIETIEFSYQYFERKEVFKSLPA
ncbi:MAG: phage tail protein, partial [Bacteroidia bacterium]